MFRPRLIIFSYASSVGKILKLIEHKYKSTTNPMIFFKSFSFSHIGHSFCKRVQITSIAILVLITNVTGAWAGFVPQYASIVVNHHGGEILHAENPDKETYPASLTKIMTLFLLFDALASQKLRLTTRMTTSKKAAMQVPTKLGLKEGQKITVMEAMLGLIVKSANDASVVIAEHLAGSEEAFAEQMTKKARAIGLRKTVFKNSTGLPNKGQRTTARDMVTLGRKIYMAYPSYYRFFKTKSLMFNGQTYHTHNKLLGICQGVDGIKTGYINASGFNLVTSLERDGTRIFAAVLGGKTIRWRNKRMVQIIDATFPEAKRRTHRSSMIAPGQVLWACAGFLPQVKPTLQEVDLPEDGTLHASKDLNVTPQVYLPNSDPIGDLLQSKVYDTKALQDMVQNLNSDEAEEIDLNDPNDKKLQAAETTWSAQFGTFREPQNAEYRVNAVLNLLPGLVSKVKVLKKPNHFKKPLYYARLEGVSKVQAEYVCSKVQMHSIPCIALKGCMQRSAPQDLDQSSFQ